ncbi:hypothetical protein [Flavobacterium piscisymbiosum]|uniref:hypothetical protein n=1 Tax=Flavobacterium piscisymbiosum TaxID=2893753 RepID=UPI003D16F05D
MTNKSGKGRKGTIVAMVAGTKADTVISVLEKYLSEKETWLRKSLWTWLVIWD